MRWVFTALMCYLIYVSPPPFQELILAIWFTGCMLAWEFHNTLTEVSDEQK